MSHLVFVYGSLKSGHWNNHLLRDARLVGGASTVDDMLLVGGDFPYLLAADQLPEKTRAKVVAEFGGNVAGEVWEVSDATLAAMDRLERVPYHYTRETIDVRLAPPPAEPVAVQVYRAAQIIASLAGRLIRPNENNVLIWK